MSWTLQRILSLLLSYAGLWGWTYYWLKVYESSWVGLPMGVSNGAYVLFCFFFSLHAWSKGKAWES